MRFYVYLGGKDNDNQVRDRYFRARRAYNRDVISRRACRLEVQSKLDTRNNRCRRGIIGGTGALELESERQN